MGQGWGGPRGVPKRCQNGPWLANRPGLIVATRVRGAARHTVSVFGGGPHGHQSTPVVKTDVTARRGANGPTRGCLNLLGTTRRPLWC